MVLRTILAILFSLYCFSTQAQQSKIAIQGQIAASSAAGLTGGTILNNMVNSYVDWLTCTGTGGLVYWSVGIPTCLTIGTTGQVLNVVAGKPAWANIGSISGAALTSANDTNVTLTLGGTPTNSVLNATSITAGWTGTLAAARLNSNVVQGVTNDTNVIGSIAAQNLTLGWTGTLAASRGGTGIASLGTGVAAALGINVGTAGAFVVNGGALGTPSSGTLTNATGLPLATGISGFGTGIATALGINTGSAGAPVLFNGALGTPSSGTLTSATGLPISTGVSGLGTGIATALGVNVGTAGAPVINGGVLGTPSSGTLTNATGLPISTGVSGLGTSVASTLAINLGTTGSIVTLNQNLGTPSGGVLTNATGLPLSTGVTGNLPDANMPNTAWTTFTPTATCGTATFTTNAARVKTWGKVTHIMLDVTFTALGTCTNALTFTLPNTPQSAGGLIGREANVVGKGIVCAINASSTTATCTLTDNTNYQNGERIPVSGVYENQ